MENDLTSQNNGAIDRPPTEVVPRARRRRFSAAYKLRILQEADACKKSKDVGSLLRREGLYTSHLSQWRKQRSEGVLVGGQQAATEIADLTAQLDGARKENRRLKKRLTQAEAIIDAQKTSQTFLGSAAKATKIAEGGDREAACINNGSTRRLPACGSRKSHLLPEPAAG